MKIYKITTPHSEKCYVGKTTGTLGRRISAHKTEFWRWQDGMVAWCSSFGLLWLGDCSIELLEETEDKDAERDWIARLNCVNNRKLTGANPLTKKLWYINNRELTKGRAKARREANLESISARKKELVACERCGTKVTRAGIRQHERTKKCQELQLNQRMKK